MIESAEYPSTVNIGLATSVPKLASALTIGFVLFTFSLKSERADIPTIININVQVASNNIPEEFIHLKLIDSFKYHRQLSKK